MRCCPLLILLLLTTACTIGDRGAAQDTLGASPPLTPVRLTGAPFGLVLSGDSSGVQTGHVAGDTAARLSITPFRGAPAEMRLCGVIVSKTRYVVDLPGASAADSALPQLALRELRSAAVQGVRFIVPGENARYRFVGMTRDGRRVVTLIWPLRGDSARPVAVGAADSLVETSVVPSALAIDSVVAALTTGDAPQLLLPVRPIAGPLDPSHAVPDVRPLPVYHLDLSPMCPAASIALRSIARADQMVKVMVDSGDVITADATITDGTVRISFDEAPPAEEPRDRRSLPHAVIEAANTGRVTLRVRVQVLPRVQAAAQIVHLRVQKTRAR
jgi:hypothetical protein